MKKTVVVYLLLLLTAILTQACGKASNPDSSSHGAFPTSLQFEQPAAVK